MESVLDVTTYDRTTIKLLVRPGALNGLFLELAYYFYLIYVVFYPNSFIVGTYCCLMDHPYSLELSLVFLIYSSTV